MCLFYRKCIIALHQLASSSNNLLPTFINAKPCGHLSIIHYNKNIVTIININQKYHLELFQSIQSDFSLYHHSLTHRWTVRVTAVAVNILEQMLSIVNLVTHSYIYTWTGKWLALNSNTWNEIVSRKRLCTISSESV